MSLVFAYGIGVQYIIDYIKNLALLARFFMPALLPSALQVWRAGNHQFVYHSSRHLPSVKCEASAIQANSLIFTNSTDPFTRGLDYLYGLRSLAIEPDMISVMHDLEHRLPVATWIGHHIDQVNAELQDLLQACHDCFHATAQPPIQIWAAPLARSYNICGMCNLHKQPIAILVDVGQVVKQDWLALVAHEYAHAYAGSPGHHQAFSAALTHLCRGLSIELPPIALDQEDSLRLYPACQLRSNSLAWWQQST